MPPRGKCLFLPYFLLLSVLLQSCFPLEPGDFRFSLPEGGEIPVFCAGIKKDEASGSLSFAEGKGKRDFLLKRTLSYERSLSFFLKYEISGVSSASIVLMKGARTVLEKALPLGEGTWEYGIRFDPGTEIDSFGLRAAGESCSLSILGAGLKAPFLGMEYLDEGRRASDDVSLAPRDGGALLSIRTDSLPPELVDSFFELVYYGQKAARRIEFELGGIRYSAQSAAGKNGILFPPAMALPAMRSISVFLPGGLRLVSAKLTDPPHKEDPIPADPGLILLWDESTFRDPDFEIFRWGRIPEILIFDFATYAVQDSFLKRLAFFTEKKGFQGRLAADPEIAELHGWNAHDYRAQDLADFFARARKDNFPLNAEERRLERILIRSGILLDGENGIRPGEGAIISISRESESYLRSLFLCHEGLHGIFFLDGKYRSFVDGLWRGAPGGIREFWLEYCDYMKYNIKDSFLIENEFQAYLLQQPGRFVEEYYGKTLRERLSKSRPAKKESYDRIMEIEGAYFTTAAEKLEVWLHLEYGFEAGNLGTVFREAE